MPALIGLCAAIHTHFRKAAQNSREERNAGCGARSLSSGLNCYFIDMLGRGEKFVPLKSEQLQASRLPGGLWAVKKVTTDHLPSPQVRTGQVCFHRGSFMGGTPELHEKKTAIGSGMTLNAVLALFDDFEGNPPQYVSSDEKSPIVLKQTPRIAPLKDFRREPS